MFKTIILHVPHSSADFSAAGRSFNDRYSNYWKEQGKALIDWYTDEIFLPETQNANIIPVVFDTCRTFCDVERLSHDPLEAQGLGITSKMFLETDFGTYDPRMTEEEDSRIMQMYLDHQYKVASLLIQNHGSLLLDCHSFSSKPTPLQKDAISIQGIDVCIGFNEDFTKPEDLVISRVREWFSDRGYKVEMNHPFSNSKTVETPADYKSMMIEINKFLYMDEYTLEKNSRFESVRRDIQGLYSVLIK